MASFVVLQLARISFLFLSQLNQLLTEWLKRILTGAFYKGPARIQTEISAI